MKRYTRLRKTLAVTLLTFLFALTLKALVQLREPSLLDRATFLTSVADWSMASLNNYKWSTNNKALFFRDVVLGEQWQACQYDLVTNQSAPLPRLSLLLSKKDYSLASLAVSYDGAWMFIQDRIDMFATRLDGTAYLHCSGTLVYWTGNAHQLVAFDEDAKRLYYQAHIYSADTPANRQTLRIGPAHFVNALDKNHYFSGNVHMTTKHTLIVDDWQDHDGITGGLLHGTIHILRGDLVGVPAALHTFTVTLPQQELSGMDYSRDGEHVAWLFKSEHAAGVTGWLHRLIPAFKVQEAVTSEIFVSAIDGTEMRSLGRVEESAGTASQPTLAALQWLPDGKHLSFICHNALWKIRAMD